MAYIQEKYPLNQDLLTPRVAAKILTISLPYVYKLCEKRIMPCIKIPMIKGQSKQSKQRYLLRIKSADLSEFIQKFYIGKLEIPKLGKNQVSHKEKPREPEHFLFNLKQLAAHTGIGLCTLRDYIKHDNLPHFKKGKIFVRLDEFYQWLSNYAVGDRVVENEIAIFPQKEIAIKTRRLGVHACQYFISLSQNGKREKVFLGSDLDLAKKTAITLIQAHENNLNLTRLLEVVDLIKAKAISQEGGVKKARVDQSIRETRKALAQLRKTITKKKEELRNGN